MVELIQVNRNGMQIGVEKGLVDVSKDLCTIATVLVLDPSSGISRFHCFDDELFPKRNGAATALRRYNEDISDTALRCVQALGIDKRPSLLNSQFLEAEDGASCFRGFMTAYYIMPSAPLESYTIFSSRLIELMPGIFSPSMHAAYRWYKMHGK